MKKETARKTPEDIYFNAEEHLFLGLNIIFRGNFPKTIMLTKYIMATYSSSVPFFIFNDDYFFKIHNEFTKEDFEKAKKELIEEGFLKIKNIEDFPVELKFLNIDKVEKLYSNKNKKK